MSVLCEALEVSMRGYYEWRKRPIRQHAQFDAELAEQLQAAYAYVANRKVYGSPRLHAELAEQEIKGSRKRVAQLRRERGLAARRAGHPTPTTHSDPSARVACNLLNRDFTASRPNEKWTGDIAAIWTYEEWLYLAVVLDLFWRRVLGWAMAASPDETLVETTLRMALFGRHPQAGFLFPSDRGAQSTRAAPRAWEAEVQVTVSMSRTDNGYENAVTQSFFSTLKAQCVEGSSFRSRSQARQALFEDTECFYNRVRRHSS